MQHALAYPAEENPERALSPTGIGQAKAAGRGIKRLNLSFDLIVASPKRRSHQTAALIAESVRFFFNDAKDILCSPYLRCIYDVLLLVCVVLY